MIRKHFRIKWLVLGLAVAALVAPAAQAKTLIQSSGGSVQVQTRQPIASEMSVQSSSTPAQAEALRGVAKRTFYKDSQPGVTSAGTAIANQKHDAYPVPVTATSTVGSDGFSWSDAGIGAGVTFAALLILGTLISLGLRQRSRGGLASA